MSAEEIMGMPVKIKRVRPTAAAMRLKTEDNLISRNVPKELRKSDQELLEIRLKSADLKEINKTRWREASYIWNEKGFLYDEYYYLTEKKDHGTNEYVWNDELLWKFARDHKIDLFVTRQTVPGLLNAQGSLRKRAPR